jgi:phthalate 4,5-cis-dihydrodiol dehydrogenase
MTTRKTLKMGMVGIGVGGAEMLPAFEAMPEIELVAGADINARVRQAFSARYEVPCYATVEELCADPNVEGIWVSTPNRFHAPYTIIAANHGKHVVVEKPMALNLREAEQMIEACQKNRVKLVAGHTRSFTPPIRTMWRIISSGQMGKARAINLFAYSDWMLRPRTSEELDPNQGGGIPYRQGPHQIDTIRVLGGGMVRSVRAMVGQWMPERPIPGYYAAYLEFEDGTPATAVHNGYGYFLASELVSWGTDVQRYTAEERVRIRKVMQRGQRDEEKDKDEIRIGGAKERETFRPDNPDAWVPEDLGVVIVSCERGDLRHSPKGLFVYSDDGKREIDLTLDRPMGPAARRAELEELYDGVVRGKPIYHTGEWGMATLEVCLAIMQSAKERRELRMSHQVAVHPNYGEAHTFTTAKV